MPLILSAFASGLLFGLGLIVSQMVNPAKVLGFLDIFGDWDPSLALVMGGAVAVSALGYLDRQTSRRARAGAAPGDPDPARPRSAPDRRSRPVRHRLGPGWPVPRPGAGRPDLRPVAGVRLRRRHDRRHGPVPPGACRLAAGHLPARARRLDREPDAPDKRPGHRAPARSSGWFSGLVGGGGSILAVPLLVYVVGVSLAACRHRHQRLAVSVSALGNLITHWRAR